MVSILRISAPIKSLMFVGGVLVDEVCWLLELSLMLVTLVMPVSEGIEMMLVL